MCMKKYLKLGIGIIAFAALLVVAGVAYKKLAENYKPEQNLVIKENVTETGQESKTPSAENSDDTNKGIVNEESSDLPDSGKEQESGNDAPKDAELAPNFTVETFEGEEVSLHDFFGKPIVLNFWASWCGPCKMELPDFQKAYEDYDDEIVFLMVNMTDGAQETKSSAAKYMTESGYTLPVFYDTKQDAAYTYGVYSLPTTYFINEKGEAIAYAQGMIDAQTLETGISMILE